MMNSPTRSYKQARHRCIYIVLLISTASNVAHAQTLNEAVTAQLEADVNLTPCGLLLSGDAISVLGAGGLFAICDRPSNQAGVPPSSVGGGFAATPPSAPSAVEGRLEKDNEPEGASTGQRGFFFTIGHDSINRVPSPFEDGYSSDVLRLAAGFDFLVGGSWLLGFAVDGSDQEGDFIDGGDFETRTVGLTGYGAYLIGDNGSLDFYAGYSSYSNERLRRATFTELQDSGQTFSVVGAPTADFDADQILAGVKVSYDWVWGNVTLGPRLGYDWNRTNYDTYSEVDSQGLALTFFENDETSSQFSGGLVGTAAISTKFGSVLIEQSLLYKYETDQDQRSIQVSFLEDSRARRFSYQTEVPDRDFLEYSLSTTFNLRSGLQILLEYRGISSHRFLDTNGVAVGFRKEF